MLNPSKKSEWYETRSAREFLKEKIGALRARNARLSLRAIAKAFSISAAHLSHLLNGREALTVKTANRLAGKLRLDPAQAEFFILLVEYDSASPEIRPMIEAKLNVIATRAASRKSGPVGVLSRISWPHLLLLTALEYFSPKTADDLKEFAEHAGISRATLKDALAELTEAKLVIRRDGKLRRNGSPHFTLLPGGAAKVLREMHASYLDRAKSLVETRSPETRFSVTEFYAIPKKAIPRMREKLEELLDEFASQSVLEGRDSLVEVCVHLNSFDQDEVTGKTQ